MVSLSAVQMDHQWAVIVSAVQMDHQWTVNVSAVQMDHQWTESQRKCCTSGPSVDGKSAKCRK